MGRLRDRFAVIAAQGEAPATGRSRLVAGLIAGLTGFLLTLLAFRLLLDLSGSEYAFAAIGAGVAAAVAATTTRVGRSIAYGLLAACALLFTLAGMVFAAIGGALG